ncbi:MAG: helix-turn-helix domain-containing protein [Cyclobacteriaceae bacterium]
MQAVIIDQQNFDELVRKIDSISELIVSQKSDSNEEQNLTPDQTAQKLNLTTRTLAKWRREPNPRIPFSMIGRRVLYRSSDIQEFILKNQKA